MNGTLQPDAAASLLELLDHRRSTWRATAAWTDDHGTPASTTFTVLDTGPFGYWLLDLPSDATDEPPDPATVVQFQPVAPSTVWDALHELLPGTDQPDTTAEPT